MGCTSAGSSLDHTHLGSPEAFSEEGWQNHRQSCSHSRGTIQAIIYAPVLHTQSACSPRLPPALVFWDSEAPDPLGYNLNFFFFFSPSVVSNSLRPHGLGPTRLLTPWRNEARLLECVAIPFSRESSWPRNWTRSPALQVYSLPSEPPGKPP